MSFTGSVLVPAMLVFSCIGLSSRCWADSEIDFSNARQQWAVAGRSVPQVLSGGIGEAGKFTSRIPEAVLFAGAFSGPVKWTVSNPNHGTHSYTFSEVATAARDGRSAIRITEGATIRTGNEYFKDSANISGNDMAPSPSVPEPSTWALMETGILILALGFVERQWHRRSQPEMNLS